MLVNDLFQQLSHMCLTHHIIEFKIAMNDRIPVTRSIFPDEVNHLIEVLMGSTERSPGIFVLHNGLLGLDLREGVAVSLVEIFAFTKVPQPDGIWVDTVESCQGIGHGEPACLVSRLAS